MAELQSDFPEDEAGDSEKHRECEAEAGLDKKSQPCYEATPKDASTRSRDFQPGNAQRRKRAREETRGVEASSMSQKKELWKCPKCNEEFTTRNQWHSCGQYSLEDHSRTCNPQVREIFDAFVDLVRDCGNVKVIPQKTRIAFQARMRFAAVTVQKNALKGHLVLSQAHDEDDCFLRVDSYSKNNHVHVFRLDSPRQFTAIIKRRIREAYFVGEQQHLKI